ncbi:hypothetical protein [Pedobacter nanyangensis]|uniref:hypothetical protein n=1 Tax=Pedobacter nanyangensis TaxID=1562389 RepID=UPI0013B40BB7|nr:hypothetical protein [Pedobacter nanyangensis]
MMKNYLLGFGLIVPMLLGYRSIESKKTIAPQQKIKPAGFIPKGFVLFNTVKGDLNKDGLQDVVLIVKGTDKSKIIVNRFEERVDRNRRGIIILMNKRGRYELAIRNLDCFSSENEDGGVYFPPELGVQIEKGNLYIQYSHGRYGYWRYTFRFRNADFELIGYDSSDNFGPRIDRETSMNFLTKKKLVKENTNQNAEGGDEVFKEKWSALPANPLVKLSQIKDFDELMSGE